MFLGIIDPTNEYIIGTPEGVVKSPYTPKRNAPDEQWSVSKINNMTGTPWNPVVKLIENTDKDKEWETRVRRICPGRKPKAGKQ